MASLYSAVILAAGKASRFGSNKLLSLISEKSVLRLAADPYLEICTSVVIVTGPYHEELVQEVTSWQRKDASAVRNREAESGGMASSIQTGISYIRERRIPCDGVFIQPGDMPLIKSDTIQGMISVSTDTNIVVPTTLGHRGHPVLVPQRFFGSLGELDNQREGLRGFLSDHIEDISEYESKDHGITFDIDSPIDLGHLSGIHKEDTHEC